MKTSFRRLINGTFLAMACAGIAIMFAACASNDPTVKSDTAIVAADKAKLATDKAVATTQPTTQNVAAVTNDNAALIAAINNLAQATIAAQQQQAQTVSNAAKAAAPVAAVAPAPWGWVLSGALTIVGAVAGTYAANKNASLQNVIAAAAPGVSQLVKQATDNTTLASDVTAIGQVAPGVIQLLTHPAAASAVAATTTKTAI